MVLHHTLPGILSEHETIILVKNVQSVASPSPFSVTYNTPFGANGVGIGLPSTLVVTFTDLTTQSMNISWGGSYNPTTPGPYTITGVIQLPDATYANPSNVIASVVVTVSVEIILNINYCSGGRAITAVLGTPFIDIPKSPQIVVNLSDGSTALVDVFWDPSTYNPLTPGVQSVTGYPINLPPNITNLDNKMSVMVVTVSLYATPKYFVDNFIGQDTNDGLSNVTPFRSITKACQVAVPSGTTDVVIEVAYTGYPYRETAIPNSGTATSRIVIKSTMNRAEISGLDVIPNTGWTNHVGGIWKKTITLPVSNNVGNGIISSNTTLVANQIFRNGVMIHLGRWPKVSTPEDLLNRDKFRYHRSTVSFTPTQIVDNGLPVTGNLAGAHINVLGWFFTQTRQITSRSGNTLTFPSLATDMHFNKWYYITNHLDLLTQPDEWFYSGNTLYLWQPGGASPSGTIEYKARNWAFDLRGKSNVVIVGFRFIGCEPCTGNMNILPPHSAVLSNNIIIDNIRAKYMNHAFLQGVGTYSWDLIYGSALIHGMKLGSNCVIKNSEFKYSATQVIWAGANTLIENNLGSDIGYEGNYGCFVMPMNSTGGQRILRNTVSRVCRSVVDFGGDGPDQGGATYGNTVGHLNMEIGYNNFNTYLMLNTDGGCIYGARGMNLTGTRVHHNWIYNCTVGGQWRDSGVEPFDWHGSHNGLYYDQGSGPTTNDHNVLWLGAVADAFIQPLFGRHTMWYNNTFASGGPNPRESYTTYYVTDKCIIRNNIMVKHINMAWGDLAGPADAHYNVLATGNGNPANGYYQGPNNTYSDVQLFIGPIETGLGYQIQATSPARNRGIHIPGITDGYEGIAPDAGAYEYGQTPWVPGYIPVTHYG